MHELSIALSILEEVGDVAARDGIAQVVRVRLRVGELSSVVNDALLFAWDLAAEGTVAAGSQLDIERVAVEVYCPACAGPRAPIAPNHLACSVCGGPAPEVTKGRELLVVAMEVVDADSRGGRSALDSEKELDLGIGAASPL